MERLAQLPDPAQRNIAVHITPAAERALRNDHPWVYDQSIRQQSKTGDAGDLAIIFDKKDRFLAVGLYDPHSPIRVKVLHHGSSAKINADFFAAKLQTAFERRQPLHATETDGYRLVYGEGDGLPGLIVDRYADVLVVKLYTAAWFPHLRDILAGLNQLLPDPTIILRLSRLVAEGETYSLQDGAILQGTLPEPTVTFKEHGLQLSADIIHGHKTGFFFDQRDNRHRVRHLSANKRVLDVFAYNGGFSVNAAAGGAVEVTSLDISAPALADAQANMQLNAHLDTITACEHHILVGDAFDKLAQLAREGAQFELVIVDPPTFASSQEQVAGALIAYTKLVRLALDVLAPSGTLVMASCSSRVVADDFFSLVHRTANDAGYPLTELARTQHALDHPIVFKEGAYLKCLFATI